MSTPKKILVRRIQVIEQCSMQHAKELIDGHAMLAMLDNYLINRTSDKIILDTLRALIHKVYPIKCTTETRELLEVWFHNEA